MTLPAWHYDEFAHCGVDFSNPEQVASYDAHHERFRDYRREANAVLDRVSIGPQHTVIDMGCGTGAFAIHAAPRCGHVFAVDVSQAMLDRAQQKAQGLANVTFHRGGFLTYEHNSEPADLVVSTAVLHHLPDFWKQIALRRTLSLLKPGGLFFLFDVVFPSAPPDLGSAIDGWIETFATRIGPDFARESESHIRDEHSTYDWIMQGLLERAGFLIENSTESDGFCRTYVCRRPQAV